MVVLKEMKSILIVMQMVHLLHATRLPLEVFEVVTRTSRSTSSSDSSVHPFLHELLLFENRDDKTVRNDDHHSEDQGASASEVVMVQVKKSAEIVDNDHHTEDNHSAGIDQKRHNRRQHHEKVHRRTRQMGDPNTNTILPKILYQVGSSEMDLPVCAPRAVCSKIDLYETPWIERQCRCPEPMKTPQVIYHYKTEKSSVQKHMEDLQRSRPQRILDIDFENSQNDRPYIKELMRKLGTVYEITDIVLDDEQEHNHGDHHELDIHRNMFVRRKQNKNRRMEALMEKRMRHTHRTDIPMIGGCSAMVGVNDGFTIADKTRHYKLCEPVHKLPICKYFKDYTWTLKSSPHENVTEQTVHCRCPRNSVTYLIKREPSDHDDSYTYLFACSPQSRLRCQRKEPCKLFTVRKRQEFLDEVNTNSLCQCPRGHRCPKHHTDSGVILGKSYAKDNIRTYSGFCMADS